MAARSKVNTWFWETWAVGLHSPACLLCCGACQPWCHQCQKDAWSCWTAAGLQTRAPAGTNCSLVVRLQSTKNTIAAGGCWGFGEHMQLEEKCVIISALLKKTQTNKSWSMGTFEILTFPWSRKPRTVAGSSSCSCPAAWQSPQSYTLSLLLGLWPFCWAKRWGGWERAQQLCSQLSDTCTALRGPWLWEG